VPSPADFGMPVGLRPAHFIHKETANSRNERCLPASRRPGTRR